MYDKVGSVLRVEIVINSPEKFKVRKKVVPKHKRVMEWLSTREGATYLLRYQEVSRQANSRYLEVLAAVGDPAPAIRQLNNITARKKTAAGRGVRAFNPLSRDDIESFEAMLAGILSADCPMPIYAPAFNLHCICVILPMIQRNKVQKPTGS